MPCNCIMTFRYEQTSKPPISSPITEHSSEQNRSISNSYKPSFTHHNAIMWLLLVFQVPIFQEVSPPKLCAYFTPLKKLQIAVPSLHINISKHLLPRRMKISWLILFSAGLVSRWVNFVHWIYATDRKFNPLQTPLRQTMPSDFNPLAYTDVCETAGLARSINTQPAVRRNSETNPISQHNRGMYWSQ